MKRSECQFELWMECNQKCVFCYNGKVNGKTPDDVKLRQLDKVISIISEDDFYNKYNKLAFIGGEFFQGQLSSQPVKEKFMHLFDIVSDALRQNKIDEVWICATLTIGNQKDLFETIEKFEDKSKVWILTSFDTVGRFHTEKMKQSWINNMKRLRETYPQIKINITSILTGDLIEKYISGTLDLFDIAKEYQAAVFLKPACPIDRDEQSQYTKEETNQIIPNFFPTREKFLEFLYLFRNNESDFMYDKLFNMQYRSDYLYRFEGDELHCSHRVKEKQQEFYDKYIADNSVNACGHSTQYQIYLDSDECAVCDKLAVKDMVGD